jgi:hypothetical protein
MRILRTTALALSLCSAAAVSPLFPTCSLLAQETTASLQGTVKDASGAVVPGATVRVDTASLPGGKTTKSDGQGYYHFANLPPGSYVITVVAAGFDEEKQAGLQLTVGRSPTVDLALKVGSESTVVDVSSESPLIDVTTTSVQTNVTEQQLEDVPRGNSFQSVIEFAPAARNEPLMGGGNGNGSCSPGSCQSGNAFGYSVAGASDSENSYLIEGQETADVIGGYSHTNYPLDFAEEVQVKSSGVEAQYGGALGGTIDVITKKGTSHYHGAVFSDFSASALNAGPNAGLGYDPNSSPTPTAWGLADATPRYYLNQKAHYSDVFPGITLGGPLLAHLHLPQSWDDRVFFFVGFKPDLNRDEVFVNYADSPYGNLGILPFSQNTNTYYGTARIDAKVTEKIRVFGSYLNEYQRQNGETLPGVDSLSGQLNTTINNQPSTYAHTQGFSAPNTTLNTGADITLTNSLVSTTRFGYFFENYHDFGYPLGGVIEQFETNSVAGSGTTDAWGGALPSSLMAGQYSLDTNGIPGGSLIALTTRNASKSIHLDQDIAWYKSFHGKHNFRFGYQLNRNSNNILQAFNEPFVELSIGQGVSYVPGGPQGQSVCGSGPTKTDPNGTGLIGINYTHTSTQPTPNENCEGQFGLATLYDYGTGGKAISYNHGIYGQDSWTIGQGLTIDAGVRFEKEYVPGEGLQGPGVPSKPINFGWGDKIAPRIGASYDVFKNGKLKLDGSYGAFVDQMKLNLAISSFGGQYWQNCTYALGTSDLSSINVAFDSNGRYCSGASSSDQGNFSGGNPPAGLTFIENLNNRAFPTTCSTCSFAQEGVAPGLKPYRQHETTLGAEYQLNPTMALSLNYDRRRLDHVIEDSAIFNPNVGETFVIVNPGFGSNGTFEGFCNFLYGPGPNNTTNPGCVSSSGLYPPNQTIPAARSYDGLEARLTKSMSNNWFALVSYTYSHLRGNYTGLTTSDQSDGIGRNAPNNSRAFDEPYFSYNSDGGSSSGLLPTDRPNAFKAQTYYSLNYLKRLSTVVGLFETAYSGSPKTTYMDIGYGGGFPVQIFGRGQWADITQDPTTGLVTVGNPHVERYPWFVQSDFSFAQGVKVTEGTNLRFQATFTNLLNEHAVISEYEQVDSSYYGNQFGAPQGTYILNGVAFYAAAESPYNITNLLNASNSQPGPITVNSQYGKPIIWQQPRSLRLSIKYSF